MSPIEKALDQVLAEIPPHELLQRLSQRQNAALAEAEGTKKHPLSGFSLPAAEWAALKAHLLDGGGSLDHVAVGKQAYQALMDDKQADFWPVLAHWIKAAMKAAGVTRPTRSGGVVFSGVGPTPKAVTETPHGNA